MSRTIVGIMGPGEEASAAVCHRAAALAMLIANEGWALLTGGRSAGVMHAAAAAAKRAGGLTIGILPGRDESEASDAIEIAIATGLGEARNLVNVLSSRVVFVCGMNAGTASEVALAIKARRPVVLVDPDAETAAFFHAIDPGVHVAATPDDAIALARRILGGGGPSAV
jgi:uncharacterized protein (TIGR00725 family)